MIEGEARIRKIAELRGKLRDAYTRYQNSGQGYDCGDAVLQYVNPSALEAAIQLDAILDELSIYDIKAPKQRFTAK